MCGRVVAARPAHELADFFAADNAVVAPPARSYNVAPTDEVYVVAAVGRGRRLGTMRWGLVPSWSAGPRTGPRPVNARVETLLRKPLFADALAHRRCLVAVDGFYEWRQLPDGTKQPFFVSSGDGGEPLALAGLWDRWRGGDGSTLVTCVIVTTAANEAVRLLHDRMPAILPAPSWDEWLDPEGGDPHLLLRLLAPARDGLLTVRPASRLVNNVANDGPDLLVAAH